MSDHEDSEAQRALQGRDEFVELRGADWIKAGGWLIEKDELWIERQGPRQSRTLRHAAGELGGVFVGSIWRKARSPASCGEMRKCSRIGSSTFCLTVRPEKSAPCWNMTPMRRSSEPNSACVSVSTSRPNISIEPPRLSTSPKMVRSKTDLPVPDPPTQPKTSPR